MFAVQGVGSTAVVGLLLSHGADPNKADNAGVVPLHIAAEKGFFSSTK
jgi:ankyrin repeat protein